MEIPDMPSEKQLNNENKQIMQQAINEAKEKAQTEEGITMKQYFEQNKDYMSCAFTPLMGPLTPNLTGILVVDSETGQIIVKKSY